MLDRIARHRNLDPAEVRRRNLVTFPYRNVLGQDYSEGCFALPGDGAEVRGL